MNTKKKAQRKSKIDSPRAAEKARTREMRNRRKAKGVLRNLS